MSLAAVIELEGKRGHICNANLRSWWVHAGTGVWSGQGFALV